jgi:perosamine synthetase
VPSLSFIATANAAKYVGAVPVFADVDRHTANVTVDTVAPLITERTAAVVVVHQAGVPADVDGLRPVLDAFGIPLVEDAACAIGSTYKGASVGAGAQVTAWSFHPRKVLTTGEGGMVTLDDDGVASRLRRLREHGMSVSAADRHSSSDVVFEDYVEVGFNYRMTDIQAAIGLVQLTRLDGLIAERRARAARYQELLSGLPLQTADDPAYGTTNYQSFWVLLPRDAPTSRDALLRMLAERGISARRGIMAAHLEPAYASNAGVWVPPGTLPVTERFTRDSLILPLFPGMSDDDQDRVVEVVRAAVTRAVA